MSTALSAGTRVQYAQARFFFDGHSTGRLEVILRITRSPGLKRDPAALALAAAIGKLPVRCRTLDGWIEVNLANVGAHLAAHFRHNTAAVSLESRAGLVMCGRPLMLLLPAGATFDEKKSDLYPDGLRLGDFHQLGESLDAAFLNEKAGSRRTFPGNALAILIDRGLRTYGRKDQLVLREFRQSVENERRATRIFMIRYHVEREGLRLVVNALVNDGWAAQGSLEPQAARALESYISRRVRHLKKPDRTAGIRSPQDPIRAAYARAIEVCSEVMLPTLLERISQIQQSLGDSLERYLSQDLAATGQLIATRAKGKVVVKLNDNRKTIVLGAGTIVEGSVVAADSIQSSFNSVRQTVRDAQLAQYLEELHRAVAHLTAALDSDEAELAAADLKELVDEAGRPSPRMAFVRRAVESLVNLASRTAEVGLPVIELVQKIRELIGSG